ncbi:unnamed protein product [Nesidiocoris tenuis]|uniref:Uncharacterized protein n=1 Tax=Nesidiocoris tenuis TaxID=355587 RepID=A0A6H5GZ93_9HEMI|nr:unnamed protein product [Nesidiocoris tenuis]
MEAPCVTSFAPRPALRHLLSRPAKGQARPINMKPEKEPVTRGDGDRRRASPTHSHVDATIRAETSSRLRGVGVSPAGVSHVARSAALVFKSNEKHEEIRRSRTKNCLSMEVLI